MMIAATTMPTNDVTYDAFPSSWAVFMVCVSPFDIQRRASTEQFLHTNVQSAKQGKAMQIVENSKQKRPKVHY